MLRSGFIVTSVASKSVSANCGRLRKDPHPGPLPEEPSPWADEKRAVLANFELEDSAFSVARRFCDGGRRDGPPLAPPSKGGEKERGAPSKGGGSSAQHSRREISAPYSARFQQATLTLALSHGGEGAGAINRGVPQRSLDRGARGIHRHALRGHDPHRVIKLDFAAWLARSAGSGPMGEKSSCRIRAMRDGLTSSAGFWK